MKDEPRLEDLLRSYRRKTGMDEFMANSRLVCGQHARLSDLSLLGELRKVITACPPGRSESWRHYANEVTAFLGRLAETESDPIWVIGGLFQQDDFGAVAADPQALATQWRDPVERFGLDLVSSDREAWAMIFYDDHFEDGYELSTFGRWSGLASVAPKNRVDLALRIKALYERGEVWLAGVDSLIADLSNKWNLDLDTHTLGNYSFVIRAGDHVLKLLPPGEDFDRQLAAMLAWNGNGAARIENFDRERGAMLIERLLPGNELTELFHNGGHDESTEIVCAIMARLAVETDYPFPSAADRAAELENLRKRFGGRVGPFPADLVEAAEGYFRDLIASQTAQVLVHADLHHENILAARREPWLAIDPHGLIAEPEFEPYALLLNPTGIAQNPDVAQITKRRLDQIADLRGFDRERVRGWAVACAVLSAWWSFEEGGRGYEEALSMARVLLEDGS